MRVSFCMQKLHDISKTLPESASKSEKDFVPQTKSSYFLKFYISSVILHQKDTLVHPCQGIIYVRSCGHYSYGSRIFCSTAFVFPHSANRDAGAGGVGIYQ